MKPNNYKKILAVLSLAIVGAASSVALADNASATRNRPHLQLKCSLGRRYLDAQGNVVRQDLTPSEVKPVDVPINGTGPSQGSSNINFSAQTPEGVIKFTAIASANDLFDQNYMGSLFMSVYISNAQVTITTPSVFGEPHSYSQPSTWKDSASLSFGTGLTDQGFVKSDFSANCELSSAQ